MMGDLPDDGVKDGRHDRRCRNRCVWDEYWSVCGFAGVLTDRAGPPAVSSPSVPSQSCTSHMLIRHGRPLNSHGGSVEIGRADPPSSEFP